MATIKQLEAQMATASTARQRAEIAQGIAFLRKQAAAKKAASSHLPSKGNWVDQARAANLGCEVMK